MIRRKGVVVKLRRDEGGVERRCRRVAWKRWSVREDIFGGLVVVVFES